MSNPPKYIEHGGVYFVTSRTEEGLPFLPKRRYRRILGSIMAWAQALYPVEVIATGLSENHLHQVLKALSPGDLPKFVGYVKQELAHAVNRIRGRRKKTIWCDSYDSPILLGPQEVLHYIAYCYTQSQSAHQCDTIEQSENPSSWSMFSTGQHSETFKHLYRTDFARGIDEDDEALREREECTLTLSPFSWLSTLAPEMSEVEAKEGVMRRIRELEAEARATRQAEGISLRRGPVSAERAASYVPKKFGKRMVCICWDIERRIRFLEWFSNMKAECKRIYKLWKMGDRRTPWPLGFFPPPGVMIASALP